MRFSNINRIIYPIVCALLVAETAYLLILYKRNRESEVATASPIDGNRVVSDNALVKGLSQVKQKSDPKLSQGGLSNAIAQIGEQSGDLRAAVSNDPQRTAHKIKVEKILAQIDEVLADDNEFKAVELARLIMADSDPEVRSEAVTVFAWAGVKGLPELSKMLADSDPGVAEEASNAWESALDDLSDDQSKAQVLAAGIKTMTDAESAESAIMLYDSMGISISIPAIVDIIQSGAPTPAGVAREHYEFLTSEEYTTPEAAGKWVADELAEEAKYNLPEEKIIKEQ